MYKQKRIAIVIPARYSSSRFPGKPLANILGQPMVEWVYRGCQQSKLADQVIVATDDRRIYKTVLGFGGKAMMTSTKHRCGSERVAEVAKKLHCDFVVNVQGDEPLIHGKIIDKGIKFLVDKKCDYCTPAKAKEIRPKKNNPNVVKVVFDKNHKALYFSRYPIPYSFSGGQKFYQHFGVHFFSKKLLLDYTLWSATPLEIAESIEQLRLLENDIPVYVFQEDYEGVAVDIPSDIKKVEAVLKNKI